MENNNIKEVILEEWANPEPVRLYLFTALLALGIYYASRMAVYFVLVILIAYGLAYFGIYDSSEEILPVSKAIADSIAIILAGLSTFLYAKRTFHEKLNDKSDTGVGLVPCSFKFLHIASYGGLLLSILILVAFIYEPNIRTGLEGKGVVIRVAFSVGILSAAIVEEFIFRGILFGGFSKTLGRQASIFLTTVLFVSLHFIDGRSLTLYGLILGVLMGVGAVGLRIWSGSVYPSMCLHFAYNLFIICVANWIY